MTRVLLFFPAPFQQMHCSKSIMTLNDTSWVFLTLRILGRTTNNTAARAVVKAMAGSSIPRTEKRSDKISPLKKKSKTGEKDDGPVIRGP